MDNGENTVPIADRLEGLRQPFEHDFFTGQLQAEQHFLSAANSGRLHHAWLLTGPRGVGKATFAFRVARYFVSLSDDISSITSDDLNAACSPENKVFGKVASGGHPNILHLRIPMDEKTKKFKTRLTVDEIRRSVAFFGTTAGDRGWRIAIVDSANDMNTNAANALLKILEEPPSKTLFFLLADQPGRLLPTIRSRCQKLEFDTLGVPELCAVLSHVSEAEQYDEQTLHNHSDVIAGSVRKAYQFATHDTADLRERFIKLVSQCPDFDIPALHAFADTVSARGAEEKFRFFVDFLEIFIASKVRGEATSQPLVRWSEVWDKVHKRLALEEGLNLDRKQTVLGLFYDLRMNL